MFAPLGVKIGAERIVDAALRYGWNAPPTVPGEAPSTLPPAEEIRTPLEVASTAIGQGKVLATPLRLASVAQVVASGGVRLEPILEAGRTSVAVRVTTRRVARTLARLMHGVVAYGTGTAAAIPGIRVAGKTGTAELEDTRGPDAVDESPPPTARTPTPGSPPTRRWVARASRWPCCWCGPGRAARLRRPRPGSCSGGRSGALERQMSSS